MIRFAKQFAVLAAAAAAIGSASVAMAGNYGDKSKTTKTFHKPAS